MTPLASSVAATAVSGSHGNHLPLPLRPPPPSPAPPLPPEGAPLPLFLIRLPRSLHRHLSTILSPPSPFPIIIPSRSVAPVDVISSSSSHSLLRSGFELLRRERLEREKRERKRRTEKWSLLPSLSPVLFLFPSLLVSLPLLSRQCSALDIRASCALPMPLTLVKPTVCMNRCGTMLLPLQRPLCRCSLRFSFILFLVDCLCNIALLLVPDVSTASRFSSSMSAIMALDRHGAQL